ncbi:hypothetical protein ACL03H_01295 [Saccharopolyspora sp. MS10]|uniref:hypothetical protein n=1 Tax=Saccharopolyspora sp. MS10 TaxID=3385973 RepID=UPI0039A21BE4
MSDEHTHTTTNSAEGSTVGIQAGQVHDSNVYITSPEDPPARRYEVGVNYLNNGVPLKARELINEAIARGYVNTEVRVHWVLAMLSKRSYRELSNDERAQLALLPGHLDRSARGEWAPALETLCELIKDIEDPDRDTTSARAKLWSLPPRQRKKIEQHCDLVLTGELKDALWSRARHDAETHRLGGDRADRVWAYFKPDPAKARARHPVPNSTTAADCFRAVFASALFAVGLGSLGWLVLRELQAGPAIAYFAMLASGAVVARTGFEWRYRAMRLRTKEDEVGYFAQRDAPEGGFANKVDGAFRHFASSYAPKGVDRSAWLNETRGIRATLRDEVVELYREERINYEQITWLIRYLLRDISRKWRENTLFAHRRQYRTPPTTKAGCLAGAAVGTVAALAAERAALSSDLLPALGAAFLLAVTGRAVVRGWWRIASERRRHREEVRDHESTMEARNLAYQQRKDRLDATRPTEEEMETWLRCDRVLLTDEALRHYRLAWRDITAHTVMQTPVKKGAKRARVDGGPWRYSKYELRLFLLTADGVRELARELDVETGDFRGCERGHFRFDAVSSLRVVESSNCGYTLDLTLSNGPARTIEVTDPDSDAEHPALDEDPALARISLDASGFAHALHVLEGIAAEGKAWIHGTTSTRHRKTDPGDEAAA